MNVPHSIDFRLSTRNVPPGIPVAIQRATTQLMASRSAAVALMPDWESLRQAAHDRRLHGILHLEQYLAETERAVRAAGGHVHRARDAAEANDLIIEIARHHRVRTVVKGKSMATEEIGLNQALERAGVHAVETDVGEFIIQLAGERPSHILGPTLHMNKEEIAAVFSGKLGVDAPPDPRRLTDIARSHLRGEFLRAEMGITGANFVVAETGTVVLVTNEGNGRLCTTLPDIHIAVAGIDKVISDWDTLAILLRLLARSATGQKMACHTSFITGPRRAEGEGGPRELHLVLLDNGRTRIQQDPQARETLLCIRCAACLNVCPVYNQVGGHAYGWIYSGGIGAILSPQLLGLRFARDLPFASTLCGACAEICPVKIPIPEILLHLRRRVMEGGTTERPSAPPGTRLVGRMASWALNAPWRYRWGANLIRVAQTAFQRGNWLPALPPPLTRWTQTRPLPVFRPEFRGWWRKRKRAETADVAARPGCASGDKNGGHFPASHQSPAPSFSGSAQRQETPNLEATGMEKLIGEINRLSGHARRVSDHELDTVLKDLVESEKIKQAAMWASDGIIRMELARRLQKLGVAIVPRDADKTLLARTDLGITEVDYALPESGSLGLASSADKPRTISILPRVHLAILRPSALRAGLSQILQEAKKEGYLVLVTGLSRTSDIESNPVLGAHGPQALHVWVME